MKRARKIVVPFLMGQRRDGLCRVSDLDADKWEILSVPHCQETDLGDANEKMRRMGEVYRMLSDTVQVTVEDGAVPLSVAGDCVSTLGVLGGLQKARRTPDRILWLDAHGDFHTWETTLTQYIGGMPLAMLVGRGDQRIAQAVGLDPYPESKVVLSDARDLDPGESEALRDSQIVRCRIAEIGDHLRSSETLYLHWDTDVLDAETEMPALKYHVKSGPTCDDMRVLFRSLRDADIVAVSVSAWHEEKDRSNLTAATCLALLSELGFDGAAAHTVS